LNARQKIPLLVDGDFRIGESAAIVAYLFQNYSTPEHALIPEESFKPNGSSGASSSSRSWIRPASMLCAATA
jgi:hypothetical protein